MKRHLHPQTYKVGVLHPTAMIDAALDWQLEVELEPQPPVEAFGLVIL